jgi:hypothetical protein
MEARIQRKPLTPVATSVLLCLMKYGRLHGESIKTTYPGIDQDLACQSRTLMPGAFFGSAKPLCQPRMLQLLVWPTFLNVSVSPESALHGADQSGNLLFKLEEMFINLFPKFPIFEKFDNKLLLALSVVSNSFYG